MTKTMKKHIILLIMLAIHCLCVSVSHAQNGYTTTERIILDRALTTLEDYEVLSSIADEEAYYSFLDLFTSNDAIVYNDLLGCFNGETMPVSDYAEYQFKQAKSTQISVANITRKRMWQEDDVWKLEYSFEKNITYTNECGTFFSNKDFYEASYEMTAVFVYYDATDCCKIESIRGFVDSDNRLQEGFYTFVKTKNDDNELLFNNRTMKFNAYGQAFLSPNITVGMFNYPDEDVIMKPAIDERCRKVTMSYKRMKTTIKPHVALGLGDCLNMENTVSLTSNKTSMLNIGVDVGYSLPWRGKVKLSIFAGLGLTKTQIDLAYSNADYSYNSNADVNGVTYIRHYTGLSVEQAAKITELSIPVYLEASRKFNKFVTAYVDLGVIGNLAMSKSLEMNGSVQNIYGIYPIYGNLYMDKNWGFNGFREDVSFTNEMQENADMSYVQSFTPNALAGVGVRISLGHMPLAIDLGVSYRMGLSEISTPTSSAAQLRNPSSEANALVYNVINGLDSKEQVKDLSEAVGKIKRQALMINMGIAYKF